ncbi:hypothetical protein EVG20_g4802 [Dentipellis fragilis]|uniref:BTB domain-containing protein n=1 Tax=Dentipellis fragilis TaxID=205917 RepID=A0A4Y9YV34_9AGAM|nr:hypothetical protein EVG20_g4802 [Dentipellis fragilis]
MEDGNVIIVCESVGFRVHRGILARHSKIFRDTFAVGGQHADQEMYENAAVLRLPDPEDDFKELLRSIYDIRYPPFGSTIRLRTLRALLLLSTKYLFEELRTQVINHLQMLFPSNRASLRSIRSWVWPMDMSGLLGVQISQECNVPSILPAACFEAAQLSASEILDDGEDSDPDVSFSARRTCLEFRDALLGAIDTKICNSLIWNNADLTRCDRNHPPCNGLSLEALQQVEARYRRDLESIFKHKSRKQGTIRSTEYVCQDCWKKLDMAEEQIRNQIWDAVPVSCGFDDWTAVKKAQAATDDLPET